MNRSKIQDSFEISNKWLSILKVWYIIQVETKEKVARQETKCLPQECICGKMSNCTCEMIGME